MFRDYQVHLLPVCLVGCLLTADGESRRRRELGDVDDLDGELLAGVAVHTPSHQGEGAPGGDTHGVRAWGRHAGGKGFEETRLEEGEVK